MHVLSGPEVSLLGMAFALSAMSLSSAEAATCKCFGTDWTPGRSWQRIQDTEQIKAPYAVESLTPPSPGAECGCFSLSREKRWFRGSLVVVTKEWGKMKCV